MIFGKGISRTGEVLDIAVDLDIIKKSGAWFSYNDAKIGQGRDNAKKFLADNPDVMKEVEEKIKANSDKLSFAVTPSKEDEETAAAAPEAAKNAASKTVSAPVDDINIDIDAEDDFEEFTPVETD